VVDVEWPDLALWVVIVVSSMVVAAVRNLSRSRMERLIRSERVRRRYWRYLERASEILVLGVVVQAVSLLWLTVRASSSLGAAGYGEGGTVGWVCLALLAGGVLPGMVVGHRWSSGVLVALLPVLYWASLPARPVAAVIERLTGANGDEADSHVIDAAKEEIRVALEDGATEGAIEETEKEMIEGILEFRDAAVSEIMTPRVDMECIEAGLTIQQARPELEQFPHSRIPVFEENRDRVVGMLYLRDLLPLLGRRGMDEKRIVDVSRKPYFVPETKRIGELLRDFQNQRLHIAVVLDEYGGVAGLITIEDILEEIVGEIRDEYDLSELDNEIVKIEDKRIEVDPRVRVSEINELLDVGIPDEEDYDTIGGFLSAHLGRIPRQGESIPYENVVFHVTDAEERRVRRLQIEILEDSEPGGRGMEEAVSEQEDGAGEGGR
jgi:CBS domain containing-hemolysin-like protein